MLPIVCAFLVAWLLLLSHVAARLAYVVPAVLAVLAPVLAPIVIARAVLAPAVIVPTVLVPGVLAPTVSTPIVLAPTVLAPTVLTWNVVLLGRRVVLLGAGWI